MFNKQIRVLQIVPSLSRAAGVARFVYNMERYHDEERVHYDFLHHAFRNGMYMHEQRYDEELCARGCNVYHVNYAGDGLIRFINETRELLAKIGDQYDIVHCHMPNSAFCMLREARNAGVKHRIMHSHLNNSSDVFLHRLRNMPLNAIGKHYATDFIACSEDAGKYLFGSQPFTVIRNGIPLEQFLFDSDARNSLRTEMGINDNDQVIGCVGRFVKQKNFSFAVTVFAQFLKQHPTAKLIILGNGDYRTELEQTISSIAGKDSVLLPGVREDVAQFYSVFDVFFMPSLYEGLPVSAVEAQAAGLPCVYSTHVPRETDITQSGTFVDLEEDLSIWVEALEKAIDRGRLFNNSILLEQNGYSAKENAELLMQYYENLIV